MAGPSKVEFPGKQRQKLRMRGTKQANKNVQQRLMRSLDLLMDSPKEYLPQMQWKGRLSWGRRDPVSKSLNAIDKVLAKRHDRAWLNRRMMRKGGDQVAKAWAGALSAAYDEEISLVGTAKFPGYGNATFVRRGDSKPIIAAGVQNPENPRLRLLAWEEHARRGWWFFSWSNGFVCTGNQPEMPEEWLQEQLQNIEIKLNCTESDAGERWESTDVGEEHFLLTFTDGTELALSPEDLSKTRKRPLMHGIALTMLPPNLTGIADGELVWTPSGWPEDEELPTAATAAATEVIETWLKLALPEEKIWKLATQALLVNLGVGIVRGNAWWSSEDVGGMLADISGSGIEREAAAIGLSKLMENTGAMIGIDGELSEREDDLLSCEASTLHHLLTSLWDEYGLHILIEMGLSEEEAEGAWRNQLDSPSPFAKFLRGLESQRADSALLGRFPWGEESLDGVCGNAHELVILAHRQGVGRAHAKATKTRGDVATQATCWAWLCAHQRGGGQEWHFEQDARDRGGGWSIAMSKLWQVSERLVEAEDLDSAKQEYVEAMKELAKASGHTGELPEPN